MTTFPADPDRSQQNRRGRALQAARHASILREREQEAGAFAIIAHLADRGVPGVTATLALNVERQGWTFNDFDVLVSLGGLPRRLDHVEDASFTQDVLTALRSVARSEWPSNTPGAVLPWLGAYGLGMAQVMLANDVVFGDDTHVQSFLRSWNATFAPEVGARLHSAGFTLSEAEAFVASGASLHADGALGMLSAFGVRRNVLECRDCQN